MYLMMKIIGVHPVMYISCSLFVNLVYHLLVKQRLSKPISGVGRAHDRKRPTDRPS